MAAIRTPHLEAALREAGYAVKVLATASATYFFDPTQVGPTRTDPPTRDREAILLDEDEWPGRAEGRRFQLGEPVLHIELRRWADLFLIAPLDANTLAKLANGLCDNALSCVWRAWDLKKPVVLAPAMNTLMWQHPFTRRHLRGIALDAGAAHIPGHFDEAAIIACINERSPTLRIVPPIEKQLACGDVGLGAMAEIETIVATVRSLLNASSST